MRVQLRQLIGALLPALALACAVSVAGASAHGDRHGRFWHEGFRHDRATVEVKGVVTVAPASSSDSFTATTFVVAPRVLSWRGAGNDARRGHGRPGSNPAAAGTPNTTITTGADTRVTLNGQTSSIGGLAVGDLFVAIYKGTPSQALSTITSTPAISVRAWTAPTGDSLYAFVGTVTGTGSGAVTVNVTSSFPTGLFSGADTFSVGSQTKVVGSTNLATGDTVAGGMIAASGESASTVESTPLQVLVGLPTTTPSPSIFATGEQLKRVERRALEMLHREQVRMDRKHDQHGTRRK